MITHKNQFAIVCKQSLLVSQWPDGSIRTFDSADEAARYMGTIAPRYFSAWEVVLVQEAEQIQQEARLKASTEIKDGRDQPVGYWEEWLKRGLGRSGKK